MRATLPCVALLVTALVAVASGLLAGPVLRRLPLPATAASEPVPDYRAMATPRVSVLVALLAGLSAGLVTVAVPTALWWAWASLTPIAVLAATVDAYTTYLPKVLAQAGWVVAVSGVAVAWAMTGDAGVAVRTALGAASVGLLFWLLWRWGGVGFGDVRLMLTVGGVTAATGWPVLGASLVLGTMAGAAWGIVHRLLGRRGAFPYGPGLTLGPFLALGVLALPH